MDFSRQFVRKIACIRTKKWKDHHDSLFNTRIVAKNIAMHRYTGVSLQAYSKHKHFRWKMNLGLEHLGVVGIMG